MDGPTAVEEESTAAGGENETLGREDPSSHLIRDLAMDG
jgi:hypothetical protein